jgi:ParB/RepB/Spo0J family partition protein
MTTPATEKPANSTGAGYKAHAVQRGETFSVPHSLLVPKPGFNRRRKFRAIPELADMIRTNGFRKNTPLTVEWKNDLNLFHVVHGERRLRAVKLLVEQGHDPGPIWCTPESRNTTPLQQLIDQVITNTGEQFTPLEKGFAYLDMQAVEPTLTGTDIADRVGETKQAVSDALRLAKLGSNNLHAAIESDQISSSTAGEIIKQAGEDHAAQDALLEETLRTATASGTGHATPKHLPKKEKPAGKSDAGWHIKEQEYTWAEDNVCTTPSTVTATEAKWGIKLIEISYAERDGCFQSGFCIQKADPAAALILSDWHTGFTTADDAILSAWPLLHAKLTAYAATHKQSAKILAYIEDLGTALQSLFTASSPSTINSQPSTSPEPFIADLSDENDATADSGTPFAGSDHNPDAPADGGAAYERLTSSPSASEGISNSDSFGKGGDPKIDGRIRKINDLLEELDKDNCHTGRWDTIELLLTYLDGKGTIAVIRKHLLTASS